MTQYTVIDTESKRTKMKSEKKKIKLWKKGRHRDPTYIHTYNWNGKS